MYVPPHFAEPDLDVLHDLIASNALGVLITHGQSGLDANHIPFDLDRTAGENGTLRCHVARSNPVWQDIATGDGVLVVFRSADAYVSPNWYPSKREHHKQVPTWNYRVAHAHGRISVRDDEGFVRRNVARLTRTHESGQPVPWKMGDAPKDYIDTMVKAVVGLEIVIDRLVGKVKLSQNKVPNDIRNAGEILIDQGHQQIGAAMVEAAAHKPGDA
ncbi:FMN-binding negative transcriptional regulator [Antarctobacter sp.]|uniref:FMN-binding negative transcriptional regulator n=1 Tax=Antarctobacter sp. TaxID=1872577 RepID=UPI003A8E75F1